MKFLINALSATNASGRHVLMGHLRQFARLTEGRHDFQVLYHRANRDIADNKGRNVSWIRCPSSTADWRARALWERIHLPSVVRKLGAEAVFNPSGVVYSGVGIPQISFAQNPWCLVPEAHAGWRNRIKAVLQRHAYRRAMEIASVMVFNSEFMRRAYRKNAGFREARSFVIYQGVDDETFAAAEKMRGEVRRKKFQIVCVSAMARHKCVEAIMAAVRLLRANRGVPATLALVGSWPDAGYEKEIRRKAAQWDLQNSVQFRGHVPKDELHRAYAESRVFCLMSRCESFGIPGVEAQAFGTPVVCSNCCAMPEIGGKGGVYPEPGDVAGVADHIFRLISDDEFWSDLSASASENAKRYRWERCSRPFLGVFDELQCCAN